MPAGARTDCISMASAKELNTVFCFSHMEMPGRDKYVPYDYDLNYLKAHLLKVQQNEDADCWPTLVFENHDNPRFINKVTQDDNEMDLFAKELAVLTMTLRGTVFCMKGRNWAFGMSNSAMPGNSAMWKRKTITGN
ncbi:MAG: alpha-amylase family glycosyl hydrolase [Acutalibacteraceae bacterium]